MIVITCRLRTSISRPSTSAGTRKGIPVPITRSSVHAWIASARIWNTAIQYGLHLDYIKIIWVTQQNNMGYIWNTAKQYGLHVESYIQQNNMGYIWITSK